jgi:glycosyltransferase involved in cell wall biosynthesis
VKAARVAVVLSNYNHARYLPESLGAICGQIRPPDEIIVVDDGSTDDSVPIIEAFRARCPRIHLIRNETNLGLQASIARALSAVTAEYLVWAASDDRLLPEFLEVSMRVLERHPRAGLCFSELSVLDGDTGQVERFAMNPAVRHIFDLSDLPEYLAPGDLIGRMRRAYLPMTSNSVVVRRDALLALGGYPPALQWFADSFAYTVIALRHGACVVPRTLALLRANVGSYSHAGMRDARRQAIVLGAVLDLLARRAYRDIRRIFRRCPSAMSPYGTQMLRLLLGRPRDWDLLVSYGTWTLKEYKRGRGLTWPRTMARLALQALEPTGADVPIRRTITALRAVRRGAARTAHRARRSAGRLGPDPAAVLRRPSHIAVLSARMRWRASRTADSHVRAVLSRPVSQATLRNAIVWQQSLLMDHPLTSPSSLRADVHVCCQRAGQLDSLGALLMLSGVLADVRISWDIGTTPGDVENAFSLDAAAVIRTTDAARAHLRTVFAAIEPLRPRAAERLAGLAPGALTIGLSLPEDEHGFVDDALRRWRPHLAELRYGMPPLTFILLNRTLCPDAELADALLPLHRVHDHRSMVLATACVADGFVGELDSVGLAALACDRVGVFVDATTPAHVDRARGQEIVPDGAPGPCLARLRSLLDAGLATMSSRATGARHAGRR